MFFYKTNYEGSRACETQIKHQLTIRVVLITVHALLKANYLR